MPKVFYPVDAIIEQLNTIWIHATHILSESSEVYSTGIDTLSRNVGRLVIHTCNGNRVSWRLPETTITRVLNYFGFSN